MSDGAGILGPALAIKEGTTTRREQLTAHKASHSQLTRHPTHNSQGIMAYTNSYKAPVIPPLLPGYYGPDPHDINWIMPLHEATLESDCVKLTPFIPSLHAKEYAKQVAAHPELHRYMPLDPSNLDEILTTYEHLVRHQPTNTLFAIIDKARGGALAGVIGLFFMSPENLSVEAGWVIVFPSFQRTYVTTNAVGLLLRYCLEPPSALQRPGLGLRRVQWIAHMANRASQATAKRMGFEAEGVLRWTGVLPNAEKEDAIALRHGDLERTRQCRHSVILSLCVDDWESGGREHVQRLIDPRE
jgi:RimJ/RimL family protein N-acetyltransferase